MNKYRRLEMQQNANHRKEEYKYFVGTTLKNPLEYEIGEKMVFKIRAKYMDDFLDIPYIFYTLISDDGNSCEGYIEKSEDGWFYIETSISKSGFVYVQAKACDEDKQPIEGIAAFNGSAGADVKNILRATETPQDYDEFWRMLEAEVEATEPEVLFCEKVDDSSFPDYECYDMRIKAPWSEYVSLTVTYPKDAKPGSLKAVFAFQGYGVRTVTFRPIEGYFSISVNAHCMPNRQSADFYANLSKNELKGYGYSEEENNRPESTYWAKMILRDMQVIRFFKDHELLNKKDYYFVGSSHGGMQACNMAARFDRNCALLLNVPWLSDIYGHELAGRRKNNMPKGTGVTYFDTAIAAQYIKCPTFIISGLGDGVCNASTQMALFNSISAPKHIEFYQNKVHSYTIPWDENVYALGDFGLAETFRAHLGEFYDYD